MIDISGQPEYSKHLKYLNGIKDEYREFFYDGLYKGNDDSVKTSGDLIANVFESPEGKKLLILWNGGKEKQDVTAYGQTYTLEYNDFELIRI